MAQYAPKSAPQISGLTVENVWRELQEIRASLETMQVEYVEYQKHTQEPDKPRAGRMYYADGESWNPGHGEGLYIYFNRWELVARRGNTRPNPGFLRLTGFAPYVHKDEILSPIPASGLTLTSFAPVYYHKRNRIPSGSLILTGAAPTVTVTP